MVTLDEMVELLVHGRARGVHLGMAGDAIPTSLGVADPMLKPPKGMTVARYTGGLEVATLFGSVAMLQLRSHQRHSTRTARLARRTLRLVRDRLVQLGLAPAVHVVDGPAWELRLFPSRSLIADDLGITVTVRLESMSARVTPEARLRSTASTSSFDFDLDHRLRASRTTRSAGDEPPPYP